MKLPLQAGNVVYWEEGKYLPERQNSEFLVMVRSYHNWLWPDLLEMGILEVAIIGIKLL